MEKLQEYFLLDPEIIFLNHGSFGATPKPVFEIYQAWQLRLERQPVLFLGREFDELMREARISLGKYVHAEADDLVYIPNATHGVNIIARSLDLKPGDEVLASDHEYGACDYTWEFICKKAGAKYIHQPIRLPVESEFDILEQFWKGITSRTKVIFLSHITSPTALRMPVDKICQRARQLGILTVVDGAHAMGQIDLDLEAIGADFYTSNCHKWALAPKGAAFLYSRREVQHLVEPLIVSWGYGNDPTFGSGSRFVDILQWAGTKDPSAALSVPGAIRFMADFHWNEVRQECKRMLTTAISDIGEFTGMPPVYPLDSDLLMQMGVVELPRTTDQVELKKELYAKYKIEVPMTQLGEKKFIRISVQGYNSWENINTLVKAVADLLPGVSKND